MKKVQYSPGNFLIHTIVIIVYEKLPLIAYLHSKIVYSILKIYEQVIS